MSDRHSSDRLVAGRRAAGRAESPESSVGDPALRQLQASVGNDGMLAQLHQGRADRSTMLAHIMDRLNVMNELQSREAGMLDRGSSWEWWRDVAKGATMPDPNRWHEAAGAYKHAMDALCRGDISRGHQLLHRAMASEQTALDTMSELVDIENLASETRPDTEMLDGLVAVGEVEPCARPEGADVADTIMNRIVEVPQIPGLRRPARPWWAEEEEEEEGKPEGDDAGGG